MLINMLTTVILPLSLFIIMFGLGLTLQTTNFAEVFKFPKAVAIGLFGQLILLPLIAFIIANSFDLSPAIAVGVVILALAPGGATSNMFTYLSKGDVALSISLTVIVSFITPFSIPIIVALAMDYFMGSNTAFQIPLLKTIIQLLVITIVPVSLGMLCLHRWPELSKKVENFIKWFSIFFLFLVIILITMKNSEHMLSYFAQAGETMILLNIIVLFVGYYMAKWLQLSHPQSVTIGFEVGIQNGTLGMVVAGTIIGNETMMIPSLVYGLLMFATGAGFSWWVRRNND